MPSNTKHKVGKELKCHICKKWLDPEQWDTHFPHRSACLGPERWKHEPDHQCACKFVAHAECCPCGDLPDCRIPKEQK